MPAFEYTGQLPQGTAITGTLEADNLDDARRHLAELTIHVSSLIETPKIRSRRALSREDLLFFNQQLASLAENNIALDEGLRAVARDLRRGALKTTIEQLAADLDAGAPLDQAVNKQAGRFPPLYADVLRAGAENNELGATLLNLNNHLGLIDSTRRILIETVTYPLIVLTLLTALVSFVLLVVAPHFEYLVSDVVGLYDDFSLSTSNSAVPLPTALVFAIAGVWPQVLMTVGCVVLLLIAVWILSGYSESGKRLRSRLLGLIPGFAGAIRASLIARFTNAAALGARAGQPLPALIRSAAGATGNALLIRDAEKLARGVESGGTPEQSAVASSVIPSMVSYTIQVAGARGELVEALADLARNYETYARYKMAMVRILLGPMVIIFVALIIGFAAVSLMLPLLQFLNMITGL